MLMPSVFGKDLFDDFFDFPFYDDKEMDKLEKKLYGHRSKNLMKTDVQETENGYVLEMDLPGFSKNEVKASLKDGYLTIKAEKGLDKNEKDEKNAKYIRRERYAGSCERSFYVGDINEADIKGEFKHGILKLTIPKEQPKKEIDTTKYIELD
ncbi:Hsp20/alpha crystallin family protein [uncultured Eubacterium sp.]|uniref:Hsp20/alpha crystallin family protein n=1 Tax=uncultured Eubacterium sp. TaxID=165185 RepID=UPI0026051A50|nr:Hsp20/alpha crystallin family protein [uncultured Eubacterium sp.]